jgi:hypothetical protein
MGWTIAGVDAGAPATTAGGLDVDGDGTGGAGGARGGEDVGDVVGACLGDGSGGERHGRSVDGACVGEGIRGTVVGEGGGALGAKGDAADARGVDVLDIDGSVGGGCGACCGRCGERTSSSLPSSEMGTDGGRVDAPCRNGKLRSSKTTCRDVMTRRVSRSRQR